MNGKEENAWHLDKKVPITMIAAFFVQTFVLVYFGTSWKADTDNRITNLEKAAARDIGHEPRIIVLEQQFRFISETLNRIERKIDKDERTP